MAGCSAIQSGGVPGSQEHASDNYGDDIHYKDYLLYAYLQQGETEKARTIVQEILTAL